MKTLRESDGVKSVNHLFQVAAARCQEAVRAAFDNAKLPFQQQQPEMVADLRAEFVIRNRLLEELRQRRREEQRQRRR